VLFNVLRAISFKTVLQYLLKSAMRFHARTITLGRSPSGLVFATMADVALCKALECSSCDKNLIRAAFFPQVFSITAQLCCLLFHFVAIVEEVFFVTFFECNIELIACIKTPAPRKEKRYIDGSDMAEYFLKRSEPGLIVCDNNRNNLRTWYFQFL
jgi:hypothetical protein